MPKLVQCFVIAPDCRLEFNTKSSCNGRVFAAQVFRTLDLRENQYFGLIYTNKDGIQKWLKLHKKLPSPSRMKGGILEFKLMVKYCPEDVSEELIMDITRKYFYSRIRNGIVSDEIYCPPSAALLLASYQVLIQMGPYSPDKHKPGFLKAEKYLPQRVLRQFPCTDLEWEEKICHWYKSHGDLPQPDAVLEYLKIAQDLEMYGVRYFPIKNSKKNDVLLGVHALGLNVYNVKDRLTPTIFFPWSEMRKIVTNGSKFTVKHPDSSVKPFVFNAADERACKEILELCLGNRHLYRVRREPDSIEVQQMKSQARSLKAARDAERERLRLERQRRQQLEKRCSEMENSMHDRERTSVMLSDYETRVRELEAQLARERQARSEFEATKYRLEELTNELAMKNRLTSEETARLKEEHALLQQKMKAQQDKLDQEKHELSKMTSQVDMVEIGEQLSSVNMVPTAYHDQEEHELASFDNINTEDDDKQEAMADKDEDFANRLKAVQTELDAIQDQSKLEPLDLLHKENIKQGRDKYKTLRNIRSGNTKKRIDQFESM